MTAKKDSESLFGSKVAYERVTLEIEVFLRRRLEGLLSGCCLQPCAFKWGMANFHSNDASWADRGRDDQCKIQGYEE